MKSFCVKAEAMDGSMYNVKRVKREKVGIAYLYADRLLKDFFDMQVVIRHKAG